MTKKLIPQYITAHLSMYEKFWKMWVTWMWPAYHEHLLSIVTDFYIITVFFKHVTNFYTMRWIIWYHVCDQLLYQVIDFSTMWPTSASCDHIFTTSCDFRTIWSLSESLAQILHHVTNLLWQVVHVILFITMWPSAFLDESQELSHTKIIIYF